MDEYVTKNGLNVAAEQDSEISPNSRKEISSPVSHLNLKDAGLSAIVWASGFRYDFDGVKLPTFDDGGEPVHRRGDLIPGLRWLYKRKSAFLLRAGSAEDAGYLKLALERRPTAVVLSFGDGMPFVHPITRSGAIVVREPSDFLAHWSAQTVSGIGTA